MVVLRAPHHGVTVPPRPPLRNHCPQVAPHYGVSVPQEATTAAWLFSRGPHYDVTVPQKPTRAARPHPGKPPFRMTAHGSGHRTRAPTTPPIFSQRKDCPPRPHSRIAPFSHPLPSPLRYFWPAPPRVIWPPSQHARILIPPPPTTLIFSSHPLTQLRKRFHLGSRWLPAPMRAHLTRDALALAQPTTYVGQREHIRRHNGLRRSLGPRLPHPALTRLASGPETFVAMTGLVTRLFRGFSKSVDVRDATLRLTL